MTLVFLALGKPLMVLVGVIGFSYNVGEIAPPQPPIMFQGPVPGPPGPIEVPLNPPKYPVAVQIPDREGFIFNPFTQNPVDVRGIPPGTLVRDPQDPDPKHLFRVPKVPAP